MNLEHLCLKKDVSGLNTLTLSGAQGLQHILARDNANAALSEVSVDIEPPEQGSGSPTTIKIKKNDVDNDQHYDEDTANLQHEDTKGDDIQKGAMGHESGLTDKKRSQKQPTALLVKL